MLFLPFPKSGWAEVSAEGKQKNLEMLIAYAQKKVSEKNYTNALKSVEIITAQYPESAPAKQYKPLLPRLEALAQQQSLKSKWTYSKTGGGNMEVVQAVLPAERGNTEEKTTLIVQTGSLQEVNNVFIRFEEKTKVPFQETLAKVQPSGQKESFVKLLPVVGNEGVFQFSDASSAFLWIKNKQKVSLIWPNGTEVSTFDLRGVDLEKLNL